MNMVWNYVILLCVVLSQAVVADSAVYPRLETEKISGLVQLKFPPEYSNLNCHATSMVAAGILTVPLPLPNDEVYFSSGCFQEIANPLPGDVGFFTLGEGEDASFQLAAHGFTFIDSDQIFQKANPGWKVNPWEIVNASYPDGILKFFENYVNDGLKLKFGRYQPSPGCFITKTQDWLDKNRQNSLYSKMIQVMEAKAAGRSVVIDPKDFSKMLNETERLLRLGSSVSQEPGISSVDLLHLLHEYLILPEFADQQRVLQNERQPVGVDLIETLKPLIAKSSTVADEVQRIFAASSAEYSLIMIGVYQDSRTVYLRVPEGVDVYGMNESVVGKFNQEQDRYQIYFENAGFESLKVTGADLDGTWTIVFAPKWLLEK